MSPTQTTIIPHLRSPVSFIIIILFSVFFLPTLARNCANPSPIPSGYRCGPVKSQPSDHCGSFVILRTNPYYSSLFNLSFYLGLDKITISQANGISPETEYLPENQLLLIPIECKCSGRSFRGELTRVSVKGEGFDSISESLEGLTSCKEILEKNPGISPWNLGDEIRVKIPIRCACPYLPSKSNRTVLASYPVRKGDTLFNLAVRFNTTSEEIISVNRNKSGEKNINPEKLLVPLTSILIPVTGKPIIGPLEKPRKRELGFPGTATTTAVTPENNPAKKKSKMLRVGAYIALTGVLVGACIAIAAAVVVIFYKKKKKKMGDGNNKNVLKKKENTDVELQQLGLSGRTATENKVSFEGRPGNSTLDGKSDGVGCGSAVHPKSMLLESYSIEEIRRATEDFNSSNHIEGSVFHGRLNGKNLAVKRTKLEIISKIDVHPLQYMDHHHHPNILRLSGICPESDGPYSFLVFEYAKNGSLKDWLHGGLAMKNQFIASCYCFLTWGQRLKICLDVALGLQYMHHVLNPSYVHRNIKSRNIFLDEEFKAKIGNFGLANCVEDDHENPQFYSTNPSSWSLGYLAPEYIHLRVISPTIDIFAYGVVLSEVLSGQTPISRPKKKEQGNNIWLSEKIREITESEDEDEFRDWMDSALGENYPLDGAVAVAEIARACVDENPERRPSAGEIVEKLSRLVEDLPQEESLMSICESSCKPLVKGAANSSN